MRERFRRFYLLRFFGLAPRADFSDEDNSQYYLLIF